MEGHVGALSALDIDPLALRTPIFLNHAVPIYRRRGADIGSWYYWEQVHFLSAFGIRGFTEFRKRECQSQYVQHVMLDWCVGIDAFHVGGPPFGTRVLATSLLIPWMFLKWHHFATGRAGNTRLKCEALAKLVLSECLQGSVEVEELPSMDVDGIHLPLRRDGCLDIAALCVACPDLSATWESLAGISAILGQPSFCTQPRITDFLCFLESMCWHSSDENPNSWYKELRNTVWSVCCALLEARVEALLQSQTTDVRKIALAPVLGRRNAVRNAWSRKTQLVTRISKTGGNQSCLADSMQAHKGLAAGIGHARCALYSAEAVAAMKDARSHSWSWDASTYGGLSINMAICVHSMNFNAVHCRPKVARGVDRSCVEVASRRGNRKSLIFF